MVHCINCRVGGLTGTCKSPSQCLSRFYGLFMAFPGAFHAGMKLHNCNGMVFENILFKLMSVWRSSEAKVRCILFPFDPRQLENELPQYITAHYRSAFLYCWEEHFLTALRFGLTLWTVTHAVDYVRLAIDMLQLCHCAPPAMRALYDNEIFTRLTASGESIATDENMEKSIGHMFKVIAHKQLVGSM